MNSVFIRDWQSKMKILKQPEFPNKWNVTCAVCLAELEIEESDLVFKTVEDMRGEEYDALGVSCPICEFFIDSNELKLPFWYYQKLRLKIKSKLA